MPPSLPPERPLSSMAPAQRNTPYLPVPLEAALLAFYPTLMLFGSLFALVSPETRSAPFDPAAQAHSQEPHLAPSYFARKDNLFNILFVKRGWAWISLAFAVFLLVSHPTPPPPQKQNRPGMRTRAVIRWALVTGWWYLVTQWFFGPPLIDRGFRFTGGKCEAVEAKVSAQGGPLSSSFSASDAISAAACRAAGGRWSGGHDISGHVFLLVLGSFFLAQEVGWVVLRRLQQQQKNKRQCERATDPRSLVMHDGAVKGVDVEAERVGEHDKSAVGSGSSYAHDGAASSFEVLGLGGKFAAGVVALSLWMLLMTAIYFHTWFEKLTGLSVALMGLYGVYILPRWIPALRHVVGLPGI